MDESLLAINIGHLMVLLFSENQHIDATCWENEEVIGLEAESSHLWLPELITLVPVADEFGLKVYHNHVESVYANWLEWDSHILGSFLVEYA